MQRYRSADEEIKRNYDQMEGEDLDCLPVSEERIQQFLGLAKPLIYLADANPHSRQKQGAVQDRDNDRVPSNWRKIHGDH
jgi:hypothetical protein